MFSSARHFIRYAFCGIYSTRFGASCPHWHNSIVQLQVQIMLHHIPVVLWSGLIPVRDINQLEPAVIRWVDTQGGCAVEIVLKENSPISCSSAYFGHNQWLFDSLLLSYQLEAVWTSCSDIVGPKNYRPPDIFSFWYYCLWSQEIVGWETVVDQQFPKYTLQPIQLFYPRFLKLSFFDVLMLWTSAARLDPHPLSFWGCKKTTTCDLTLACFINLVLWVGSVSLLLC